MSWTIFGVLSAESSWCEEMSATIWNTGLETLVAIYIVHELINYWKTKE